MSYPDNLYFITREQSSDKYQVWKLDINSNALLKKVVTSASATLAKGSHLQQVGNYLLQWSSLNKDNQYAYRLLQFNPDAPIQLGSTSSSGTWCEGAVQAGSWSKGKFFGSRSDFANPDGAKKGFESGTDLVLLSMHNFVLNWIPTPGRGTYQLFNFDPGSSDPLPAPYTPQGAWLTIQAGHQLMYIHGYVLDWTVATGDFALWQFDAAAEDPLSYPAIRRGNWKSVGITSKHQLVVVGDYILDWEPDSNAYRLWKFDCNSSAGLSAEPVKKGTLPKAITKTTIFTAIETLRAKDPVIATKPGTMDFMRDKIEHVVYYMIENRSFDHICGWLYSKSSKFNVVGPPGAYKGVDSRFTNRYRGKDYAITKYNNGKLSEKTPDNQPFVLDLDKQDPYHDNSDVLRQLFSKDINDYYRKNVPDMGGFALNNGTEEVMLGYSPEQLPVVNGLAKSFAISDEWFCSMPGGTDVNRAFSLTGNSLGQLNNFQNGVQYSEWWMFPHRPSIWKVLWSNGITDFKIYNAVEWINCKFTYNLFLKGQIPSIDGPFTIGSYSPQLNQFFDDLKYGTLPKFSYLEPKWVASAGSTSYHPGNDLIPGERQLNDIIEALQNSKLWEKTLLVITFDEHGGIADHVPPPYATKPYANDSIGGFDFDLMGVRVPTILVSPWITENTVFRSHTDTAYDATSFLATLLEWCGIPRSRWGLGERTSHAPTFEGVFRESKVRKDRVKYDIPWDSNFPKQTTSNNGAALPGKSDLPVHDLHRLVTPRIVADMMPNHSNAEREKVASEILENAKSLKDLHQMLDEINRKHGR